MSDRIEMRGVYPHLSANVGTSWKAIDIRINDHDWDDWDRIESSNGMSGPPELMFAIAEAILEIRAAREEAKFRETVATEVIDSSAAKEATAKLVAGRALNEAIDKAIANAKGERSEQNN